MGHRDLFHAGIRNAMWSIYLPLLCARRFSHIPSFIPHHTTLEVRTNRPLYKRKLGVREGLDTAETLACEELSSDVIRPFITTVLSREETQRADWDVGCTRNSLEQLPESPWVQGAPAWGRTSSLPTVKYE